MKYDYDLICIGLGPAGMAVSVMGSEMGLKVCAIEKHKIGGECMNVGCIPSKALLRMGMVRHATDLLEGLSLEAVAKPGVGRVFDKIRKDIAYINEKKTLGMFDKVELLLGQGEASFVDEHTVAVADRRLTARRIFIATGTRPMVPPIPGLDAVDYLTNETIFALDSVPESMVIIGGGAIGCEMAQAFSRLGCRCSIVHLDPYLIPAGEPDAGELIEKVFAGEGITVCNGRRIARIERGGAGVVVHTEDGAAIEGERLLVAAGRRLDPSALKPENAGVRTTGRGALVVNKHLRTSRPNIYAVGDCNGGYLLSHAAMHQGMLALMNCMLPAPMRLDYRKFVVPWTVFTDPQVSHVGEHASALDARGVKYRTVECRYADYGAAIAENIAAGSVRVYVSALGRIYGARIVGEGSGEMINEWGLAIQKKIRMHDLMLLQHSFPTMSFLSKRVAETWMMQHMQSSRLKALCRFMFRIG